MVKVVSVRSLSTETEPRALSSVFSIEELFGGTEWKETIGTNYDAYKKVALVRACINLLAHFSTQKGFHTIITPENEDVKAFVDSVNARVNMDKFLSLWIIRREIDGRAGSEIVPDGNGKIVKLLPLVGSQLKPEINKKTFDIDKFIYSGAEGGYYEPEQVLYFTLNSLKTDQLGMSAIDAIKTVLKLKRNLEKDLLEASKRLWAPIGMYELDTSMILDPQKKEEVIAAFKAEIKPGQSMIHNQKVKATLIDMKPDINGLVKALEKADEEIMGNWSIPKALLSREKTLTKATLEYSLKALWEGPIASIQLYFRRELEAQWYPKVLESAKKGWEQTYEVKHIFNPLPVMDPQLLIAVTKAVVEGVLTEEDFYNIIGWEMKEGRPGGEVLPPGEETEEV